MIKAEIIADSISSQGHRLTTYVLTFPRIVLAEFNTHRMLSRNSASSRAIPFKKMLDMVQSNPFIPIRWMKDHSGMQGTEYIENGYVQSDIIKEWLQARDYAVEQATKLSNLGLTKQIVNRVLEPFMWHTVIVTASEWENFFALRAHPAAEIHIADLAEKMLVAYNESTPKKLKEGDWHIPFGDKFDQERLSDLVAQEMKKNGKGNTREVLNLIKVKIATARCARVSYMNFEGKDDYEADIALFDRLSSSGHFSPFEHCARVMSNMEYFVLSSRPMGTFTENEEEELVKLSGWSGNFRGFVQFRKTLLNENQKDNRVLIK